MAKGNGNKTTNFFQNFFRAVGYILLFVLIVSIFIWVYMKFFAPESYRELITNTSTVEDINGKRAVVEVVYYENADNSGVELLDVKLNYYSDLNANNVVSAGVQIIGSISDLQQTVLRRSSFTNTDYYYTFLGGIYGINNYNRKKLCFYRETDGLNYAGVDNKFDDFGSIRVEMDDKVYALQFGQNTDLGNFLWVKNNQLFTFSQFVREIYEEVKTLPVGNSARTFDFKNCFKVFDVKNDRYVDISQQEVVYNYMYIDFTHYTTGATTAKDSVFGMIQYNTNYTVEGATLLDDHFSDKALYELDYNYCSFEFDGIDNVYYFDIKDDIYEYLKDKDLYYKLTLDLDYLKSKYIESIALKNDSNIEKLGLTSYFTKENGVMTEVVV